MEENNKAFEKEDKSNLGTSAGRKKDEYESDFGTSTEIKKRKLIKSPKPIEVESENEKINDIIKRSYGLGKPHREITKGKLIND
ncbi:hypothetical protein ES703_42670 [subsurface metagenome]